MVKALKNDYKSTGIGLSIVKKIVETYLGEIWLKSKQNEETTFYFTLLK
jgi:signal transduction histidine kinase